MHRRHDVDAADLRSGFTVTDEDGNDLDARAETDLDWLFDDPED